MRKRVEKLLHHEKRLFRWINSRIRHWSLNVLFGSITHLGGAWATIAVTLGLSCFAKGEWRRAAINSLIALALSHIPVALIKRKYPRQRPYLVLPQTITGKNPLTDHSFPSGHSTAIFSVAVPFMLYFPWLTAILLPISLLVSTSRMYLGLHYPTDCLAGILLGTSTAFITVAFLG